MRATASFDNLQLSELHRIYEDICYELRIGANQARRDEVAALVMDLAKAGELDISALHSRLGSSSPTDTASRRTSDHGSFKDVFRVLLAPGANSSRSAARVLSASASVATSAANCPSLKTDHPPPGEGRIVKSTCGSSNVTTVLRRTIVGTEISSPDTSQLSLVPYVSSSTRPRMRAGEQCTERLGLKGCRSAVGLAPT
jgi:hypothetical protein